MAKLMVVAALVLLAGPGVDEQLDKATAKAAEMGNYSCTMTTKFDGGAGGGRGNEAATELKVKADAPMHIKRGEFEAFKKGDVLVAKDGDTWKRVERPERGQGGGEGGADRRRGMAVQMLRGVRAPHEILKDLKSSSFKEVKTEDADGGKVFSGELTDEALKALRPAGRRGGGGGGQDRPAPKSTGTARIWVNGDGVVTKYEVHTETTTRGRNDEDVTMKLTSTVEIKDVGSTKYDVPEAAAKEFEAKSAEK